jgi:phage-related minor tail protein
MVSVFDDCAEQSTTIVGAAISNGFVQTAKTGMAVAHTLETIAVLGGNTKEEMAALSNELTRLGNSGPQGPLAIADAMKVLSLAGLKANEIIAVTQDVLNFSISGTTDLKTAADTLISVSTAFGMGAAGFGRVGDVIAKAAAESKTSVDSFANAMKTASVINAKYGVSLEDTATGIAEVQYVLRYCNNFVGFQTSQRKHLHSISNSKWALRSTISKTGQLVAEGGHLFFGVAS